MYVVKGTIVATLLAAIVYLILGWVSASVSLRHASGNVADIFTGNLTSCSLYGNCTQGMINNMEVKKLL